MWLLIVMLGYIMVHVYLDNTVVFFSVLLAVLSASKALGFKFQNDPLHFLQ